MTTNESRDGAVEVLVHGQPRAGHARRLDPRLHRLYLVGSSLSTAPDAEGVLRSLCAGLVTEGCFQAVAVDALTDDDRLIRLVTSGEPSVTALLSSLPVQNPPHHEVAVTAARALGSLVKADVRTHPSLAAWRDLATEHHIQELAGVAIGRGNRTMAVLTLACDEPVPAEVEGALLLLAQTVGFALERLDADERLCQALAYGRAQEARLRGQLEAECARISARVSEEPVQLVAAIGLRLGLLRHEAEEAAPQLDAAVAQVHDMTGAAIESLRQLLIDLEPAEPLLSLEVQVRASADQIFANTRVLVRVHDAGKTSGMVSVGARWLALGVVREAMTTARDQAGARVVDVALNSTAGGLEVTVVHDGDPVIAPGWDSTRQRALSAGGFCHTEHLSGGTLVRLRLPYVASGPDADRT